MAELSREQKKLLQQIALFEKLDMEAKRKLEKNEKRKQQESTSSSALKKSHSVMAPSTQAPPLVKQKPKITITYAPGALEQNARYMYNNKVSVEKSSVNWYQWAGDQDRQVMPYKRQKLSPSFEAGVNLSQTNQEQILILQNSSPQRLQLSQRSQATTQEQQISNSQEQPYYKIGSQIVIEEPNHPEDCKSDQQKWKAQASALEDMESNQKILTYDLMLLEATQRAQNELRKRHMIERPTEQQLYHNLAEGKSLRAALLLTAKKGASKNV